MTHRFSFPPYFSSNKPENPFQSYDGAKQGLKIKANLEKKRHYYGKNDNIKAHQEPWGPWGP